MLRTVTISDPRSYTNIETLQGKNPTEIHGALGEFCGEYTVDRNTANRFRGSCVSIDNDLRPGSSRTSTDVRSEKLLADALEEERRAKCE